MLKHARHLAPLLLEHRLTELTYFTTDICNMKCRHCFVHDALNRKNRHLSVDEISEMARFIPAMQRVHLGGGEPFTRNDIGMLATRVSNEWNAGVVCVPTNGWFTDRILAAIEYFGGHGKGHLRVHFSINSPNPDEMDEFTQLKGTFARWRRSIHKALGLSRQYPNVTIVALATYNEHNQHRFKELIDFLHEDVGVEDFSFQLVRTHGDYAPKLDLHGFREANAYYFERWNKQSPVLAAFRRETRAQSADYFEYPSYERRCTSGKIRIVMSPDGDIYPCEKLGYPNLSKMAAVKMGNVRDFGYDVHALVNSPQARSIYASLCSNRCHCDHNIDQSLRLLSNAGFRNKVIRSAVRALL
jgi:MoaA/NifB/PqqE/SkfB family radical SAM enzyme